MCRSRTQSRHCGEEGGREHALKDEGVAAKRVFDKVPSGRLNRSLRAAFGGGKDGVREADENGLFGHTFKPYPNRIFVLFYWKNPVKSFSSS